MQTQRRRAVLACPDPKCAKALRAALTEAGYPDIAEAADAASALVAVSGHRPSAVLAYAALPGGDGMALARRITALPLARYPDVALVRPAGLKLPGEASPGDYGAMVLDLPVTASDLAAALHALQCGFRPLPPGKAAILADLLDRLGVPGHPGRDMLARAVALAWRDRDRLQNLKDFIYPDAAQPFGRTGAQAERAMRHVIEAAWRTGEIEEQHRILGDTIDARRGRPTCREMIAHLADILRREG